MYDPLAWMENTKTRRFRTQIDKENDEVTSYVRKNKIIFEKYKSLYAKYAEGASPVHPDYAQMSYDWYSHSVKIQSLANHTQHVWIGKTHRKDLAYFTVHTSAPYAVYVSDDTDGAEAYKATVVDADLRRVLIVKNISPIVGLIESSLIVLEAEKRLQYRRCVSYDLFTKERKVLYEEKNEKHNLELIPSLRTNEVFLKTANAIESQSLADITVSGGVSWFIKRSCTILPISERQYASDTYLVNKAHVFPKHKFLNDLVMSSSNQGYVTLTHGMSMSLYAFQVKPYQFVHLHTQSPGSIHFFTSPFQIHVGLEAPDTATAVFDINVLFSAKPLISTVPLVFPETLSLQSELRSAGGVPFTYTVTKSLASKAKKLVVCAYGAYGINSARNYPVRWLPWLADGYALVVVAPRGGRDKGDAWYDGGRTALRKHHTFEDTAAVIRAVQASESIEPKNTIMYGRSAGGWTAAAIAHIQPPIVGGVYAEVPYLDVLRTTTNPALPLTTLEYDEFGDPLHHKSHYAALKRISPLDSVPPPSSSEPKIYIKTALNDAQVLPYEALKYATKLREANWPSVYLHTTIDGGHFASDNIGYARDATVLQSPAAPSDTVATVATVAKAGITKSFNKTRRRRTSSLKQ